MWAILLAYVINFPYFKFERKLPQGETNLDRDSEIIYKADKRFLGPLYLFVLMDTLTWLWSLCVISGIHPSFMPASLFEDKISKSFGGYILFVFVWGYMAGVNGLAGHELIHRKEAFNKGLGMFTFSKIFYSHFLLEHSSGHHRNVATPEDSATARKGETFYAFTLRSSIGGHINTYNREVNRITLKYSPQTSSLIFIFENRMTWFVLLHAMMMLVIYNVFGIRACAF